MKHFARLLSLAMVLLVAATPTCAQIAAFSRVRVANGPVLEYPAHWKIADEATVQNRVHAAQATADAASIDISGFRKRGRVIIESEPAPHSAQIRASIVTPQDYSQNDLRTITAETLRLTQAEFEADFRKMSAAGTVRLHKMGELRVEKVAGKFALVVPYTRYTVVDPEVWQVEQIKIPFEDRLLSLTLSYRSSDTAAMKPILDRVKRTLAF